MFLLIILFSTYTIYFYSVMLVISIAVGIVSSMFSVAVGGIQYLYTIYHSKLIENITTTHIINILIMSI